ncbi:MAG: YceD family protein [Methylohalobius sp.]
MSRHLPDLIDPFAWVDRGWHWQGKVPLARLSRLVGMILNPESEAEVDLTFGREGQVAAITGKVWANLEVVCQRCLEPLQIDVCSPVNLGVVGSIDEGNRLPEPYEPLLLEQTQIPFSDIVEDELILAIPPIPRHAHCKPASLRIQKVTAEASRFPNPFAELAKLKTDC